MKLPHGYEIKEAEKDVYEKMSNQMMAFKVMGISRIVPSDHYLTKRFIDYAQELYNFKDRSDDVFILGYELTGTTKISEVLWAILHNKNLDNANQGKDAFFKVPMFEAPAFISMDNMPAWMVSKELPDCFEELPNPRILKSHLFINYMNPSIKSNNKMVYAVRDPCEVCIYAFRLWKSTDAYKLVCSLEDFVDSFISGHLFRGSYLNHLLDWWSVKDLPNVHTIFYDEMNNNTASEVKKLVKFLEVDLTDEQIKNVVHYSSMEEMKKRDFTGIDSEAKSQVQGGGGAHGVFSEDDDMMKKYVLTDEMKQKIRKAFKENMGEMVLPYDLSY